MIELGDSMEHMQSKQSETEGFSGESTAWDRAFTSRIGGFISKLEQLRDLLSDPELVEIARRLLHSPDSSDDAYSSPQKAPKGRGGRVWRAACDAVASIGNETFTKRELAERMRAMGFDIDYSRTSLYSVVKKLIQERLIELVEQGGGSRPSIYRKIDHSPAQQSSGEPEGFEETRDEPPEGKTPNASTAAERWMRVVPMARMAVQCANEFDRPFEDYELIQKMVAGGYEFAGDPALSIQPVLKKLVRTGKLMLEIGQIEDSRVRYRIGKAEKES